MLYRSYTAFHSPPVSRGKNKEVGGEKMCAQRRRKCEMREKIIKFGHKNIWQMENGRDTCGPRVSSILLSLSVACVCTRDSIGETAPQRGCCTLLASLHPLLPQTLRDDVTASSPRFCCSYYSLSSFRLSLPVCALTTICDKLLFAFNINICIIPSGNFILYLFFEIWLLKIFNKLDFVKKKKDKM